MPLPKSHMTSLRANLKGHADALADLRRMRDAVAKEIKLRKAGKWSDPNPKPKGIPGMVAWLKQIEREIAAWERQLELARDPRWLDGLAKLLDEPDLAKAAARDPRAYARKLGLKLPPEITVKLTTVAGGLDLKVTGYDPLAPFELHWTEDGFSRPVVDAPSEPPKAPPKQTKQAKSQPRKRAAPRQAPKR